MFRGEDGIAHVMDAYCPHLGANLAVGGRVVGNCLECPFHGWQFRGDDGKCVKIPYAEKGTSNDWSLYFTKRMYTIMCQCYNTLVGCIIEKVSKK